MAQARDKEIEASSSGQVGMLPYDPTPEEVRGLIDRASKHPLGLDFLKKGAPEAVAAIFEVHAFVVDRARESLANEGG